MASPAARRATYADLERVPPHRVAEIVDGRLYAQPRPAPEHGAAALQLGIELGSAFQRGRGGGSGGWFFLVEPELHLGEDVVVPDLAGWRRERLPARPGPPYIDVAPDWVCEILSPSTERLDRGPKRRVYAAAGVGHLWLLDPVAQVLEAFSLAAGQWLLLGTVSGAEAVSFPPFEAISFPLSDLFPFDAPKSDEPVTEG